MINPLKREPSNLEALINDVEVLMERADVTSEEYQSMLKTLERLESLRNEKKRKSLDPNVILGVLANLAGIAAVINAERLHVLNTKVWGLLLRPRS